MKTPIILTVILLVVGIELSAQAPPNPTEGMSPNAKSFQRYGDIPVSLYTGTPNVSITLATLQSGALTLPVTLSYHSGGIKADEHPGWVGLGWTLIAGGCITREVRDIPDETHEWGYMAKAKFLSLRNMTSSALHKITSNVSDLSIFEAIDTQPDKFNFNFPGYSGYFILDEDGKWCVSCERPIKVESNNPITPKFDFPNGAKTYTTAENIIPGFTLTAEDGVKYIFGKDAIELSISSNNQFNDNWTASAWHLIEIVHPNGDTIKFNYQRGDFIVNFSNGNTIISAGDNNFASLGGKGGQLISPVYLKSINSEFSNVYFSSSVSQELNYTGNEYSDRDTDVSSGSTSFRSLYCPYNGYHSMSDEVKWRKLDKIEFWYANSGYFKTIKFDYSSSTQQRLTLLGIELSGYDNNSSDRYRFDYHMISAMPKYLSQQTDHWGFYNNRADGPDSPDYRKTNPTTTTYGILKEIRYPTGGKTIFKFEPNEYNQIHHEYSILNESGYCGGARIKQIINVPADGSKPEIKTFAYVNEYSPGKELSDCTSSGILEGKPIYNHTMYYYLNGNLNIREESTTSLTSIINNCGFHIAYPTVYEIQEDGGYTCHTFLSPTFPGFRDESPSIASDSRAFLPHSLKAQYRGRILDSTRFDSSGKRLMSESYSYDIIGFLDKWVPSLYLTTTDLTNPYNSKQSISYTKYSLYRDYTHTVAETTKYISYYGAPGHTKYIHTYKKYNSIGQLKSDSTITIGLSSPDIDVTTYSYNWENDSWYESRHFKNLISDITTRHNGKTISHISNQYSTLYRSGLPVLSQVVETSDGSSQKTLYSCHRYDSKGKPIEVTDADGLTTIYLWGPDRLYPVAKIQNGEPSQVYNALGYDPEDAPSDPNIQHNISNLRDSLTESLVTSYTYVPYKGVTSITDPAGKITYFGYDSQSRLTHIWDSKGKLITKYSYETFSGKSTGSDSRPIILPEQ